LSARSRGTRERAEARKRGLAWVALHGGLSAFFLAWLALEGEAPSGPLIAPIPRESYYAWEAVFVVPVRVAMALAFAGSAHAIARKLGGSGTFEDTFDRGARALALPFLSLWLLPDVALYLTGGFERLTEGVRFTAAASSLGTLVLAVLAVRRAHALSTGRAIVAALVGLVAQAVLGAPWLR
jgi:hypothetical protein